MNTPDSSGPAPPSLAERERRIHAERSLYRSEEIFRLLVEGVRDYAIFLLDPGGHIVTWNLGAERIKGYAAEEIIGKHLSTFYPLEQVERGWPEHELEVAAAEGRFEDEGWRVRKDGSLFWASVIITAVFEKGRLLGFSKVTRDLTERRQSEEDLRHARGLLEKRVEERTEELTRANEELRDHAAQIGKLVQELAAADRQKTEFLATLAHELRNPLAPISNALSLLRRDVDPGAQEQARAMIERQVGQMVRLVDDLLDVSRITSSKLHLRKELIELADAIENALETSQPLIERDGHQLTVTLPPEPIYVDADLTRLAQVFTNLLNNAAKYTERGGRLWLTLSREGSEAVVSVRDTGIGIDPEHLPTLFEMFSQATPALERSGGGLGVGLALARGIVELHGGRIDARSAGVGYGTELVVRLPTADPPAQTEAEGVQGEEARKAPALRILIADDNQDAADSLGMLLEIAGHEICIAHDGPGAVQAAETFRPDVGLLDIGMPGMNGYEVARHIRQQPAGAEATLVAITGWGQEEDKQRSLDAGFDYHLTKPVDYQELVQLLAQRQR